jgi:spoIIIJ-associated protein
MNTNRNQQPIRIEAKSVEQAITLACVKLNVSKEALAYKVLKEPKQGLVSFFMGAKAEIEAWPRAAGPRGHNSDRKGAEHGPSQGRSQGRSHGRGDGRSDSRSDGRDNSAKSSENRDRKHQAKSGGKERYERTRHEERQPREERAPAEPLSPELQAQLENDIREFCKDLCERITGENVTVTSNMTEGKLKLEVDNAAIANIIQTNTKFVESLEHILRKKPRNLKQELPFRIFIDAQGSRKGREEELARIAKEKAEEVVSTGQKCVLDYKSAADRKIIHMALENDSRVYTKSIGNGPSRKLMILLSRGRKTESNSGQGTEQGTEQGSGKRIDANS